MDQGSGTTKQRRAYRRGTFHYCFYALATTTDPYDDVLHVTQIARKKAQQDGFHDVADRITTSVVFKAKSYMKKNVEAAGKTLDGESARWFWQRRLDTLANNLVINGAQPTHVGRAAHKTKQSHDDNDDTPRQDRKRTAPETPGRPDATITDADYAKGLAFCGEVGGAAKAASVIAAIRAAVDGRSTD